MHVTIARLTKTNRRHQDEHGRRHGAPRRRKNGFFRRRAGFHLRSSIFHLRFLLFLALAIFISGCSPSGPHALLKGKKFLDRGDYADAVTQLKIATSLLATNAQAWNYLALAWQHAGRGAGRARRLGGRARARPRALQPQLARLAVEPAAGPKARLSPDPLAVLLPDLSNKAAVALPTPPAGPAPIPVTLSPPADSAPKASDRHDVISHFPARPG